MKPPVLQARLTRREEQVFRLAAQGAPAKQIAEALSISPRTVRFHLSSIYRKLNVSSQLQLVANERLNNN